MSRLLQNLEELVAVPTAYPDGDEERMATSLAAKLQAFRPDELRLATAPRVEGPAAAWVFARWGTPQILLNVHIDTVPAGPGWESDPLGLERDGGRVIGLGAADVKGSIAAILEALERRRTRPENIAILFSGDEERGNVAMRHFLNSPQSQGITRALVCEPTQNQVGSRHRGILSLLVAQEGPGGHSSRADFTPSPVAELASVAADLQAWGQEKVREAGAHPEFPGMCLNLGRFEGGVAFNVIPASAQLEISARPAPGNDVEQVRDELISRIRSRVPDALIDAPLANPPFQSLCSEDFIPWLGERAQDPVPLGFWTEAALLSQAGINAVVFGPGNIAQAHAANEWISVDQLEEAVEVFERVIARAQDLSEASQSASTSPEDPPKRAPSETGNTDGSR